MFSNQKFQRKFFKMKISLHFFIFSRINENNKYFGFEKNWLLSDIIMYTFAKICEN